jgi:hypothetical protein
MRRPNSCWRQFPKEKVFISFNEADRKRMEILRNRINKSELIEALVVEDEREGNVLLTEMVKKSMDESNFLIVILSDKSINEQWVNQEIGYAMSREKMEVLPVVQNSVIKELKGFIHRQSHLPYRFDIQDVSRTDNSQFGKVCNEVKQYLESKVKSNYKLINSKGEEV